MKYLWINFFSKKELDKKFYRTVLKNNILFNDLNEKQINILEKIVHIRNYSSGEYVFRQGKPGAGFFIIAHGKVVIQKENINIDEQSEKEIFENTIITTLKDSDFFGEVSLVEEHSTRTASAKAIVYSTLIGFFKPDLLEIMKVYPIIGMKILYRITQVLSKRLIETTKELEKQ